MPVFEYPVPRSAAQTASDWSEELGAHLGCPAVDVRERSEAVMRLPLETVRMELMDGSLVEFRCAFFIVCNTKKAVAVFTEHLLMLLCACASRPINPPVIKADPHAGYRLESRQEEVKNKDPWSSLRFQEAARGPPRSRRCARGSTAYGHRRSRRQAGTAAR